MLTKLLVRLIAPICILLHLQGREGGWRTLQRRIRDIRGGKGSRQDIEVMARIVNAAVDQAEATDGAADPLSGHTNSEFSNSERHGYEPSRLARCP